MEKIKVDFIQLFPHKFLKHKIKIDREMNKIRKTYCDKEGVTGILWGYGEHYLKDIKGKSTYYICFSNDETFYNQFNFYSKGIHQKIINEIGAMLKKLNIK